jgi:hypothetical protein
VRHTRAAPLLAGLALSVLAHAVTLSGSWLHLPRTQADPAPLMARLQRAAPAAIAASPPAPPARVVTPAPKPRAATIAAAPATTRSDAPTPWTPTPEAAVHVPETEAPAPVIAQPEPPAPEPVIVAAAAPTTLAIPEPVIIKTLSRRGRIEYKFFVVYNNLMTDVARTVQSWEATGGSYTLDSKSAPIGLARLFPIGPHDYHSSGQVTERGLQPQRFTSKEVRRGVSNEAAAQFDWDKNQLQFGRAAEQKNAALPAGSQDFVSFMFQLSIAPPAPGRVQMPITNGKNFETYELDVLEEQTLETPMGPLRVLPVKRVSRPGSEGITVYLATEYRHLPVRIVHFNRDGTPGGEVIATSIHVE